MRQIAPVTSPLNLSLSVPGDKSISHRALLFTVFTEGVSKIRHLGTGADIQSTIRVLRQLGMKIDYSSDGNSAEIHSTGLDGLSHPDSDLDCGNSGTTMRLMAGLLAGRPFRSALSGDESLRSRPMKRIVEPLESMGASIKARQEGTAPLEISPAELTGIDYTMPVASAQVKSAIILAGLQADGKTLIREQTIARRHTEEMLRQFGASTEIEGPVITIEPLSGLLKAYDFVVPGDPSSAAFWAAAAAISPGSTCTIEDIHLSTERIGFYRALSAMGAQVDIQILNSSIEPRGNIKVTARDLYGITLDGEDVPGMIDELPLVAVLGAYAHGTTTVLQAEELRHKECDRIRAICHNLQAMGIDITEYQDGFEVTGGISPKGAKLDSFGDHRIAMAFAVAAMAAEGPSQMINPEAASISYPEFWRILDNLGQDS